VEQSAAAGVVEASVAEFHLRQPAGESMKDGFAGATKHDLGTEGGQEFNQELAQKIEDHHSRTMMALVRP
jgi:hypothetical protein